MNDLHDRYLNRVIKNMAAGCQPPPHLRSRLLRQAAAQRLGLAWERPYSKNRWLSRLPRQAGLRAAWRAPYTQSEYFAFQLATASRLAV
jgi:hypothetical protein